MKRKYYLRGLGFGILVTTLVFILVGNDNMTDEEVIRRAKELGYEKIEVTPTGRIDLEALRGTSTPKATQTPTSSATPKPTESMEPAATQTPTPSATPKPTEPAVTPTSAPSVTPQPTESVATPTPTETITDQSSVKIQVKAGMTSMQVCRLIADEGIVEDWKVLNQYMVSSNLADYINIGTFTLSKGMTNEEIGHILTGR